jgi:multicomponent Na+:H+ antiporter subunit G
VKIAIDVFLALAVLAAWLSAAAFVVLHTAFERLHVVTFLNVATGTMLLVAAFCTDGISSRSLKSTFLIVAVLAIGALLTHVTGRALHLREGERR